MNDTKPNTEFQEALAAADKVNAFMANNRLAGFCGLVNNERIVTELIETKRQLAVAQKQLSLTMAEPVFDANHPRHKQLITDVVEAMAEKRALQAKLKETEENFYKVDLERAEALVERDAAEADAAELRKDYCQRGTNFTGVIEQQNLELAKLKAENAILKVNLVHIQSRLGWLPLTVTEAIKLTPAECTALIYAINMASTSPQPSTTSILIMTSVKERLEKLYKDTAK